MGYFDDDNEDRRLAFMLGYQAAQSTMLDPEEVELVSAVHAATGKFIGIIIKQVLEHKNNKTKINEKSKELQKEAINNTGYSV